MLGKLLKHEFNATGRLFLPVFALLIILTPLLGSLISIVGLDNNSSLGIIMGLSMFGYIILLLGVFVACFVFIVMRFYKSMTTDEAYLTFTLPVKTSSLILSRLIPAFVWNLVTMILVLFSIAGFTLIIGVWELSDIGRLWDFILQFIPSLASEQNSVITMLVLLAGTLFFSSIAGTLQIYASIALGQTMRTHRLLFSFVYYIVLYVIMQIISTICVLPLMSKGMNPVFNSPAEILDFYNLTFTLSIGASVLFGIGCYILTVIFFKKKLNLE